MERPDEFQTWKLALDEIDNLKLYEPHYVSADIWTQVKPQIGRKRLFYDSNMRLGAGPGFLQKDDILCITAGSSKPLLLRKHGGANSYWFLGFAYLDGAMNGELTAEFLATGRPIETFEIR